MAKSKWPDGIRLDQLKHLDWSTFDPVKLSSYDIETSFVEMLQFGIFHVIHHSGFMAENDPMDFPFNAMGIPWVERYLDAIVKPCDIKWGGDGELEIIEATALAFDAKSSPQPLARILDNTLWYAAMVLGQCLAQEHKLQWAEDGRRLNGAVVDGSVGVLGKVRKFVKCGIEDSLVGYSKSIEMAAFNRNVMKMVQKTFEVKGCKFGDKDNLPIFQCWHDEQGRIIKVIVLDGKTREVLGVEVMGTMVDGEVRIGDWSGAMSLDVPEDTDWTKELDAADTNLVDAAVRKALAQGALP